MLIPIQLIHNSFSDYDYDDDDGRREMKNSIVHIWFIVEITQAIQNDILNNNSKGSDQSLLRFFDYFWVLMMKMIFDFFWFLFIQRWKIDSFSSNIWVHHKRCSDFDFDPFDEITKRKHFVILKLGYFINFFY